MNSAFTCCAIFLAGWVSPDFMEPISSTPDNLSPLQTQPLESAEPVAPNPEISPPRPSQPPEFTKRATKPGPRISENSPSQPSRPHDFTEPASPIPEILPREQSQPQPIHARPAPAMNEEVAHLSRMPLPPTDPRGLSRTELPLPPTMNDSGMLPNTGRFGLGLHLNPPGQAENSSRHALPQKAFENYRQSPSVSPYALLNASTDNGTISPYMSYVRPAEEQQQASQEMDRATNNAANQPAPTLPAGLPELRLVLSHRAVGLFAGRQDRSGPGRFVRSW